MNKIKQVRQECEKKIDKEFDLGGPSNFKPLSHFTMWDRDNQMKLRFNQSQNKLTEAIIKNLDEIVIEEVANSAHTVEQIKKLLQESIK